MNPFIPVIIEGISKMYCTKLSHEENRKFSFFCERHKEDLHQVTQPKIFVVVYNFSAFTDRNQLSRFLNIINQ